MPACPANSWMKLQLTLLSWAARPPPASTAINAKNNGLARGRGWRWLVDECWERRQGGRGLARTVSLTIPLTNESAASRQQVLTEGSTVPPPPPHHNLGFTTTRPRSIPPIIVMIITLPTYRGGQGQWCGCGALSLQHKLERKPGLRSQLGCYAVRSTGDAPEFC